MRYLSLNAPSLTVLNNQDPARTGLSNAEEKAPAGDRTHMLVGMLLTREAACGQSKYWHRWRTDQ